MPSGPERSRHESFNRRKAVMAFPRIFCWSIVRKQTVAAECGGHLLRRAVLSPAWSPDQRGENNSGNRFRQCYYFSDMLRFVQHLLNSFSCARGWGDGRLAKPRQGLPKCSYARKLGLRILQAQIQDAYLAFETILAGVCSIALRRLSVRDCRAHRT